MNFKTLVRANLDRAAAVALIVGGAVALIVGWIGISGVALAPEQLPYLISGGLGGIFLGALGSTLWLSADLHDEWRRLDALEETMAALVQASASAPAAESAPEPEAPLLATGNGHKRRVGRVSKTLA